MTVAAPIGQAIGRPIGRAIGAVTGGSWTANFVAGQIPPEISTARLYNAFATNSSGFLQSFGNNVPRIDFDPVILQPRGLFVEPARTNLIANSEILAAGTGTTVTSNNVTAPNNTLTADTMTANVSTGTHLATVSASVVNTTAGLVYAHSFYMRAGTHRFVQAFGLGSAYGVDVWANFDLQTGTVGSVGAATTAFITNVGNGFYRGIMVGTATATVATGATTFALVSSATAPRSESWTTTGTESAALWGFQVEQASYPSSYIQTTGSSATRVSDNMLISNLASIGHNASEFTILCEVDCVGIFGSSTVGAVPFGMRNAGVTDSARPYIGPVGGAWNAFAATGGVTQVDGGMSGSTDPRGSISRVAISPRANSLKYVSRGMSSVTTVGTYSMGTFTALDIGSVLNTNQIGGRIRYLQYIPSQISDSNMLSWVNG